MSIQQAYAEWSSTYDSDRNLTRDLDQSITQKCLDHLQPQTILEIGCGTGKNSGWLSTLGAPLIALDFSIEMLARAKAKHSAQPIDFMLANLTEPWPCSNHPFSLIVCNLVLEHIQALDFIFAEAARCLKPDGLFFISELHPFRQYQGTQANFQRHDQAVLIPAFTHPISDFLQAARSNGFALQDLNEWWHAQDTHQPPRLVSFLFKKLS